MEDHTKSNVVKSSSTPHKSHCDISRHYSGLVVHIHKMFILLELILVFLNNKN